MIKEIKIKPITIFVGEVENFDISFIEKLDDKNVVFQKDIDYCPQLKQLDVVRDIAQKINERTFICTSHFPYFSSIVNNRMYAFELAQKFPEKVKFIKKIISEKDWIDYNKVAAYKLYYYNGILKAKNIFDSKFNLIDLNKIDILGDVNNTVFASLSDIEHEE